MPKAPEWERRLECCDATGRPAELSVAVSGGSLVLRVPPGESAVFTGEQRARANELRCLLVLAVDQLARGGRS